MMVAEVTAIPTVQHTEVGASCYRAEVFATSVVISAAANNVPRMTSAIAGIEDRTSEVEVVAVWIAGIDAEVPVATIPVEWAVEVAGGTECLPLPFQQHVAHVQIATLPIGGIDIIVTGNTHQVVQIDFVGSLVLLVGQVQLVGHLVRQEQCLVACLLVAHCMARCCYCQHGYQGYHHLLHTCLYF